MTLSSCLYEGHVLHHRQSPVEHRFWYSLFLVYVDLEELPTLFAGRWLWSVDRPGYAWFRRADHLGPRNRPLGDCVRDLVEKRTGWRPTGPIRLLTHFRYLGFLMNPVSFYYCFDEAGKLAALVAEVNNTPWNERHCYVVDLRGSSRSSLTVTQPKQFHVSPFLGMDFDYHWRLSTPGSRLALSIENRRDEQRPFRAALVLHRKPMTAWNLNRVLLLYPLMTLQVFAGIYWQAARLWWKRVPYVPHPGGSSRGSSHVQPAAVTHANLETEELSV